MQGGAREQRSTGTVLTVTIGAWLVFTALSVALGVAATSSVVERVDAAVYDFAVAIENIVFTAIAAGLRAVGSGWVTVPVIIAGVVVLAGMQRRRTLGFWIVATVGAQVLVHTTKWLYGRERPPDPILSSVGDSYPSGHATTAASLSLALIIAFLPVARRRPAVAVAVVYTVAMAASRVYLRTHWLSDVVAGVALGTAVVLTTALVFGWTRIGTGEVPGP